MMMFKERQKIQPKNVQFTMSGIQSKMIKQIKTKGNMNERKRET